METKIFHCLLGTSELETQLFCLYAIGFWIFKILNWHREEKKEENLDSGPVLSRGNGRDKMILVDSVYQILAMTWPWLSDDLAMSLRWLGQKIVISYQASHCSPILTKVGEEEEKEKLSDSMPRHFPEEMAEAKRRFPKYLFILSFI